MMKPEKICSKERITAPHWKPNNGKSATTNGETQLIIAAVPNYIVKRLRFVLPNAKKRKHVPPRVAVKRSFENQIFQAGQTHENYAACVVLSSGFGS